MTRPIIFGFIFITGFCLSGTSKSTHVNDTDLQISSLPKSDFYGLHDSIFNEILGFLKEYQTYSFMVLKNGSIVCEKYFQNYHRNDLINGYSMGKSFLSALLGIAIQEGVIRLDDKVSGYITPPVSGSGIDAVNDLKVKHLASMTSGLDWNWHRDYTVMREKEDWLSFLQTLTIRYVPGTKWEYSADPLILSAVLEKAVGMPLWKYAEEKLLEPLGINRNFYWARDAKGLLLGDGYVFSATENFAKFGQLFLNQGKWNGKRIIDESWIRLSTSPKEVNPDYGYLWWTKNFEGLPDDLYYAYGGHGQFIVVIPSENMVIVRTGHGPPNPDKEFLEIMIKKVLQSGI